MTSRASLLVLLLVAGCGDNQQPASADELWTRIHQESYRDWARAPRYETRRPSSSAHGNMVDIFVNHAVEAALLAKKPLTAWPEGSLIVKDGFSDQSPKLVAVMEKRGGAWFFAEYDPEGSAKYSGQPGICTGCHESGSDSVRAFMLPK